MEKESVKKFDLEAAFKALDEIDIPVAEKGIKANRVDLKERFNQKSAHETLIEDYYDVSSHEDLEEAQDEREAEVAQAKLARIEKIVDLDADSPDDLLPSYVGKVIIQCPQCMTLFYKNPEDIDHSEENPDVVNINEVCQHCGNTSGYNVIGKVGAVDENEADNYTEEPAGEENELDLNFEEPTEEVDAEGTGEGAEEMSDEELSDDELKELELDLEEIPEEEPEEEKKEESLNLSKEAPSENETEHKSENLTLNEEKEKLYGIFFKEQKPEESPRWSGTKEEMEAKLAEVKKLPAMQNRELEIREVKVLESLNNSEELKDAEEGSELKTENESENLTLNEEVDKDLDAKLKAHNDYIEYLQQMIKQEEEALKKADNDEIKAAIQRRLDAFNADLEEALPDAVKSVPEVAVDELADSEPVVEEEPTEVQAEEEPKEEPAEEEAPVDEQLTEDAAEEEKPAEGNEVDYVEYKHSYCHALEPKLKAINYLVNVKKVEPKILKGYILKLLKDADVKWTEKEKEFKKNIEEKEDVYDILNYVKNSIEKAKTIKVKVDENGELVEGLNEGFEGCLYEVLTESLNKSEEAPSEHETENGSENLTLNEDVGSEIDSIIASWDFNESLNEEGDLDKVLDSEEFKEPVSDKEVEAIRQETLGECAKQELTEEPDPEVKAIVDSWEDEPCEGPECEEGYTGNPAERTTHLEYTDDDPTDGKAVLPKNIEKQLTEAVSTLYTTEEVADLNDLLNDEPMTINDFIDYATDLGNDANKEGDVDAYDLWMRDIDSVRVIDNIFLKDYNKENAYDAIESVMETLHYSNGKPLSGPDYSYFDEYDRDSDFNTFYDDTRIDHFELGQDKELVVILNMTYAELKDYLTKTYDGLDEGLAKNKECKDGECEKPLEECSKKPLKEEDEVPAEEEAPVEEPVEGEANAQPDTEETPNVVFTDEEVKEIAEEAVEEVVEETKTEVEPKVVEEKVEEVVADAVEEKVEAEEEAPVEAEEEPVEGEEIPAEVEEPEFSEDAIDDLDECSLNKHIDEYLQEVYSNVKCFEATNCELKNKKLIIEGKISFNSGKEKLTMFEFLPAYCDGKLFFEGYNKDFSEDKAFTLNCSINESKTLITESFGYKYKINENLVEGLK